MHSAVVWTTKASAMGVTRMSAPLPALRPSAWCAASAAPSTVGRRSAVRVMTPTSGASEAHTAHRANRSAGCTSPCSTSDWASANAIWVSSVNSPGRHPNPPPPSISPHPPSTGWGNVAR
jgi:hypothetical protein